MNKLFFCWALLIVASCSPNLNLWANDSVKFPAGPAVWTVVVTESPNAKAKPSTIRQLVNIKAQQDGQFQQSVMTYDNGITRESWTIQGSAMMLSEDPRGTPFLTSASKNYFVPYLPSCFDWVQPNFLQEKDPIDYNGKSCFHYKGPMPSSPSQGPGEGGEVQGEAWIDSKTLLPVAIDDGIRLGTFTFLPTPISPLEMPAKYKNLYQGFKNTMGIPMSP